MKLIIKPIYPQRAIDFIQKYHYSKILPRLTKHYLGYFENEELVGVVTLGWGTQPFGTIHKIFYKHNFKSSDYLEIGKMCFLPSKNQSNFGSQSTSLLIKWIKTSLDIKFLYTMADGIMGKCGYVYQASNFRYLGSFKTSVYMDIETHEKIHPRSAKQLCIENAIYENKEKIFWLTHDFCEYKGIVRIRGLMFRYIYPINKSSKKILNQYPEYTNKKYPKDIDLIFEKRVSLGKYNEITMPTFNMNVFNHNYQKYKLNMKFKDFFNT